MTQTKQFPTGRTEKTTPADDDLLLIADSEDGSKVKTAKWSNLVGPKGDDGDPGTPGTPGEDGTDGNGIASITTNKVGKTTTVTITEDNSTVTTFDVEDGADGEGSGDMLLAGVQSVTGAKTFDKDKLLVKGTSTGTTNITTANISANNYTATFPAKNGTVAMTADLPDITDKVDKSTYDANTILKADSDNTPAALTVGEQTVVGRATGGNITTLAIDSDLSNVSANDDTIPSAKATKAMGDSKLALDGGTVTGATTIEGDLTVGKESSNTGQIDFVGTTSGTVSLKVADAAGTWTMTLPVNDGDANQFLQTNGSGVCTWADGGVGGLTKDLWYDLTGTYASTSTFTFTGTAADALKITRSIFTCTDSAGTTRRIGYVKSASETGGTVTVTVVSDSNLAVGDKDFKITPHRKVEDYKHLVTIPGEVIADASNPQGMWYRSVVASYMLPVNSMVKTAAAGTGAACAWNVYDDAGALFSSAIDLTTNATADEQRPTTITEIAAGSIISLRITSSAGATNKASDFQAEIFLVPSSLFGSI